MVNVFLMAKAVSSGRTGRRRFTWDNDRVPLGGICMAARELTEAELIEGVRRSTMKELAAAIATPDRLLAF